ncbi:hypothetical protein MKX03_004973 [Papaver bracteatum]|nr:hypothetical protein MKX03_004973 [Papaver bracteatum]
MAPRNSSPFWVGFLVVGFLSMGGEGKGVVQAVNARTCDECETLCRKKCTKGIVGVSLDFPLKCFIPPCAYELIDCAFLDHLGIECSCCCST